MTTSNALPPTPGRRAGSNLAQHDLAGRLARLPIPREAIPRLTRFVVDEVAQALEAARRDDLFTAEEIEAAGSGELLQTLREARDEQRQLEVLRTSGLAQLPAEELKAIIEAARR